MDSIIFYQPTSTITATSIDESTRSSYAPTTTDCFNNKRYSATLQRNEFNMLLNDILDKRELLEVLDMTTLNEEDPSPPQYPTSEDKNVEA